MLSPSPVALQVAAAVRPGGVSVRAVRLDGPPPPPPRPLHVALLGRYPEPPRALGGGACDCCWARLQSKSEECTERTICGEGASTRVGLLKKGCGSSRPAGTSRGRHPTKKRSVPPSSAELYCETGMEARVRSAVLPKGGGARAGPQARGKRQVSHTTYRGQIQNGRGDVGGIQFSGLHFPHHLFHSLPETSLHSFDNNFVFHFFHLFFNALSPEISILL